MAVKNYAIGNWKMNLGLNESYSLAKSLADLKFNNPVVAVAPSYTAITGVKDILANSKIMLAAQNCAKFEPGAYTGEVSVKQIKDIGVTYCIVGHSERRSYFNESNDDIAAKAKILIASNITPIVCIGENLEVRDKKHYLDFLEGQLNAIYSNLQMDINRCIIAYEPIWAIGTGKTANLAEASEVHRFIRNYLVKKIASENAKLIAILYGGSVKPDNAKDLIADQDINGFLIGGASLKHDDFSKIVQALE